MTQPTKTNTNGRHSLGVPGCYRLGGPTGEDYVGEGDTGEGNRQPRREPDPHYGLSYWDARDKWIEQGRRAQTRRQSLARTASKPAPAREVA